MISNYLCEIYIHITNYMLEKAFAVLLVIFSAYILFSFLLDLIRSPPSPQPEHYHYHLGCYETQHPLNRSHHIRQYLANLTN